MYTAFYLQKVQQDLSDVQPFLTTFKDTCMKANVSNVTHMPATQ